MATELDVRLPAAPPWQKGLGKLGAKKLFMPIVRSYRDLLVWQRSRELAKQLYIAVRTFPRDELFGLTSQIRRSAISIPSNIAEGHARDSSREFARFISIALGSLAEAETQLILANDLSYLPSDCLQRLLDFADTLGKQLRALQKAIKEKAKQQ